MRVLGVDPGSRVCGYGVIDVGSAPYRVTYVECGVLTARAELPLEARLGEIAQWLTDVVTELRPEVLAVEDVFTNVNARSALALAQARGMVLAVAGLRGLRVHAYAPTLVKKTVTGRGHAAKDQVAKMVAALVGLKTPPRSDAADALAVAVTHAQHASVDPRLAVGARP